MTLEVSTGSVPVVPLPAGPGWPAGRWSVAGAVVCVVVVIGAAMLVSLFAQQGYVAWRLGLDRALDLVASRDLTVGDQRDLFIATQLGAQFLELALIFWLARAWHADGARALGLEPAPPGVGVWVKAIALLFAVKVAATLLASGLGRMDQRSEMAPFAALVTTPLAWAVFFVTVVLAGVTEELLFRGILSRTLEATRLGFWGGASLASGAFALLHMQYGFAGQFVIFAIGLTLSWIRARSGSLWPAIVCHAVNNGVAMLALRALT